MRHLMDRIQAPVEHRTVVSGDGTRLAVYAGGRGRRTMVLAPGLGANLLCWKYVLEDFQGVYRMITWDPRGTYGSEAPRDRRRLRLEDHVADLEAIVAAEGLGRFVLGGWSMGVQIALEHAHRHPGTAKALVLINGHYGHLFHDVLDLPPLEPAVRGLLKFGVAAAPLLQPLAGPLFRAPFMPRLLKATGMLTGNEEVFSGILEAFSHMDFPRYLRMIDLLGSHSAEPYLEEVDCPVLITAGTRDLLTPPSVALRMHKRIRGARLALLEGGTHYAMVEVPRQLHAALETFLRAVEPDAFAGEAVTVKDGQR